MCEVCDKDYTRLGQTNRPEYNGADAMGMSLTFVNPENKKNDSGFDSPCLLANVMAGNGAAVLVPELQININFCPFCGNKLKK